MTPKLSERIARAAESVGFVNDAASAESARSDLLAIAAEVAAMEERLASLEAPMTHEAARAMEGE